MSCVAPPPCPAVECCEPLAVYTGEILRVAQIADYGLTAGGRDAVGDLIDTLHPELLIAAGGNDYLGNYMLSVEPEYGQDVYRKLFLPVPGNDDWDAPGIAPYLTYFAGVVAGRKYYQIRFGTLVEFFMLDSGYDSAMNLVEPDGNAAGSLYGPAMCPPVIDPVGGSVQWTWFVNRVVESPAKWKVAVLSRPPFSSGIGGSTPALQWQFGDLVDLVLSGYDRSYERLEVGGITYVVNGLGGAPITAFGAPLSTSKVRYNGAWGALVLEFDNESIKGRFVSVNNTVEDRFEITK